MIRQPDGRTEHSYKSQLSASEQWTSELCYQWPNINHKGLQRPSNEYAEERRIYKGLISQNEK